jgi:hypothetical protein
MRGWRWRGDGGDRTRFFAAPIARRDQQGAIADHLGKPVHHPVRIAPIREARRQPIGNPQRP